MPADCIIAALGAGTFLFILKTGGEARGVYCWDHAHMFRESSEDQGNTYFVAPTFREFLDSLTVLGQDHT